MFHVYYRKTGGHEAPRKRRPENVTNTKNEEEEKRNGTITFKNVISSSIFVNTNLLRVSNRFATLIVEYKAKHKMLSQIKTLFFNFNKNNHTIDRNDFPKMILMVIIPFIYFNLTVVITKEIRKWKNEREYKKPTKQKVE